MNDIITINGADYEITEDAYLTGDGENAWFQAHAIAPDGEDIWIYWMILPDFDPDTGDDQGNACDWDKPMLDRPYQRYYL